MDNKILYTAKFTQSLVEIGQKIWKLVRTDRQTDEQTDRLTDRQRGCFLYTVPKYICGGYNYITILCIFYQSTWRKLSTCGKSLYCIDNVVLTKPRHERGFDLTISVHWLHRQVKLPYKWDTPIQLTYFYLIQTDNSKWSVIVS